MIAVSVVSVSVFAATALGTLGHRRARAMPPAVPETVSAPPGVAISGAAPDAAEGLDLPGELRAVLTAAVPAAGAAGVALDLAVMPGLWLGTDAAALRGAVAAAVAAAIAAPSCTRVLLSARAHGGRVELAILDDGAGTDPTARRAALREAERTIGLQGGSLELHAAAGEGTSVRLRLPVPDPARRAAVKPPARPALAAPQGAATEAVLGAS